MGPQSAVNGDLSITTYGLELSQLWPQKVSTRCIFSPLEVDQAHSSLRIGNQWAANYLWKVYAVLNYCSWGPWGFIQRPGHTNHAFPAPVKWQVTHSEACMRPWAVVCVYWNAASIHNLISSPTGPNNNEKNLSIIYYNSPLFCSYSPVATAAPWKMCYLPLLTHLGHCWYMYWLYLLRLSQQRRLR